MSETTVPELKIPESADGISWFPALVAMGRTEGIDVVCTFSDTGQGIWQMRYEVSAGSKSATDLICASADIHFDLAHMLGQFIQRIRPGMVLLWMEPLHDIVTLHSQSPELKSLFEGYRVAKRRSISVVEKV